MISISDFKQINTDSKTTVTGEKDFAKLKLLKSNITANKRRIENVFNLANSRYDLTQQDVNQNCLTPKNKIQNSLNTLNFDNPEATSGSFLQSVNHHRLGIYLIFN